MQILTRLGLDNWVMNKFHLERVSRLTVCKHYKRLTLIQQPLKWVAFTSVTKCLHEPIAQLHNVVASFVESFIPTTTEGQT